MNRLKEISTVLSKIKSDVLIHGFLKSILTKNEIKNISLRWELVKLLEKGVSQRKIVKELNISLCKITRGSKELKKRDSALKKIVQNTLI